MAASNERGTVWSDRKVRLEICIARKKMQARRAPEQLFSFSVRFLFNRQPLLVCMILELQREHLVFFLGGYCVKGKDCFQNPE